MEGDQPPPDGPAMGRPHGTGYTTEIGLRICERLMEGVSLRSLCAEAGMPAKSTVLRWLAAEPDFVMLYGQARRLADELMADELLDIADDGSNDYQRRERQDGRIEEVFSPEHVQRSRLRCDMRRWLLARRQPRRYGDPTRVAEAQAQLAGPEAAEAKPVPTITAQQREAAARALAQRYNLIEANTG